MTPKQKQWKQRSWFKFRLCGFKLFTTDLQQFLTSEEKILVQNILIIRDILLENFDKNSRLLGFNVLQHKCDFCERPAKKEVILLNTGITKKLCNKCIAQLKESLGACIQEEHYLT